MVFHALNGKLMKITARKNYKGVLLDKLKVGMEIKELINLEPNLMYDEFKEWYTIKGVNGVIIEGDAYNRITSYNVCYTKLLRLINFKSLKTDFVTQVIFGTA